MKKGILFILVLFYSGTLFADSMRCGRQVVKDGDSVNTLTKKCGKPRARYKKYEEANNQGRKNNKGSRTGCMSVVARKT